MMRGADNRFLIVGSALRAQRSSVGGFVARLRSGLRNCQSASSPLPWAYLYSFYFCGDASTCSDGLCRTKPVLPAIITQLIMLEASNITFRVGNRALISEVSVSFAPGKLHLVIGPNGASLQLSRAARLLRPIPAG